jgi:hypothetical protein
MSGIAPKQNAFKFKIAPHKQKSIVTKKDYLLQGPSKGPHNLTSTASGLISPKSGTDDTTNCSIVAGKS